MGRHEIRLISAKETYFLRQMNLRPKLQVNECGFPNDEDPATFHVGLFDGDQILSVVSFVQEPMDGVKYKFPFRLRGMATHNQHQGKKLGSEIVMWAFRELENRGCDFVWCRARIRAIPFYERLGFTAIGPEYETGNGPHKTMYKVIKPR